VGVNSKNGVRQELQPGLWPTIWYGLRGKPNTLLRAQLNFLYVVFVPLISAFLLIRVIPILIILLMSFTNYTLRRPQFHFVGLVNFARLFKDLEFLAAFWNSVEYVFVAVPVELGLGLLFALMLSRKVKFEALYETFYFIPYILPMVPAAIVWKWFFSPGTVGLANYLLNQVGLPMVSWMSNPAITLLATIWIHVWKSTGFFVIIFLVGLKNIPQDFREAAAVDGANVFQTIWHIELPVLKPIILFSVVMATIWAWSAFTEVYIMTQGTDISTGTEIQVLVFRIYQEGFLYFKMGYAAVISSVLFVVSLLFVAIQFMVFKEER
jgi:multiple sugar transport system permease protein